VSEARRLLLRAAAAVTRRFERSPPARRDVRRILLCASGGLGNAVLLEPLVRSLRAGCPEARLDLLMSSKAAGDLVGALGWADRVLTRRESEWEGAGILRFFAGPVRAERYDWVLRTFLTAPEAARASLATYLSGAPVRVAYGTARANPFETHILRYDEGAAETDRHLALAGTLGLEPPGSWQPSAPPDQGAAWAAQFAALHAGGAAILGMHPGSDPRYTAKRWPARRFGELAGLVATRLGLRPVVFGGPDDAAAVGAVVAASSGAAIAAAGQGIGATAGLIARCAAFLTNDSGLMHVASLLGVPTLALFGPSDPVKNRPLDPATRILRLGLPCSPCSKDYAMNTCDHHDCLETLEVSRVLAALEMLLADAGSSGREAAANAGRTAAADREGAGW
jgi:lipopolysaccharide heptosyltransferase II